MFYQMCTDMCKDMFLSGLFFVPDMSVFLFCHVLTCDGLSFGNNSFVLPFIGIEWS